MKKVLFIFTFILLLFSTSQSFATTKCLPEKTILDTKNSNSSDIQTAEENYTTCLEDLFNIGYDAINKGNYLTAVDVFTSYLKLDPGNEGALFNLNLSYKELGLDAFNKEDWKKSINYYLKALSVDKNDFDSLYNLGGAYYNQDLYKEALEYYKKSYKVAENEDDLKIAKDMIDNTTLIIENGKDLKGMPTNDPLSGYQYYLKKQNIIKAWEQVKEPTNKVIIAIIDDGININHPDLKGRIWTNSKEIPGDKIDNDKNGFIDDFNGWNFVYKNNNTLPLGWHGTMVSGIIGANINNKEGVSGITKNVELMPIGVCSSTGCEVGDIVKGIDYAIKNGANIINISLQGNQFSYTKDYDAVIKKAYDKGIVIVMAAGNGDDLSGGESGVNLDVNKMAPICSYGNNPKRIIGVAALDREDKIVKWSNYGVCAPFYSYGVEIDSTFVPAFSEDNTTGYSYADGTSFSAPQVAGIIGLGFNKYGKLSPDTVWDALKQSITNNIIDASKYLDIIGKAKLSAEKAFDGEKTKNSKLSKTQKTKNYNQLLTKLNSSKSKLKGDSLISTDYLISLLNKELGK